ncbi:MAG: ADP-ribosylglycohydrolase family protein [Clostridia bacterium]|nr:ADP-ribosylglycohydrolase family protein [Clostridia bacterium]
MDRKDRIRGCMIGGAAGDALGYPVEFLSESRIFSKYGQGGIENYEPDPVSGRALISDDTQMALFTANGLLLGLYRAVRDGAAEYPRKYVLLAYGDWLLTQRQRYTALPATADGAGKRYSWLMDIPELYSARAPGNTCLSALERKDGYSVQDLDYVKAQINGSKGCGGIMRTAPVALIYGDKQAEITDMEAAQIAALTHGHPLGFLPSAVLNHMLSRIVYGDRDTDLKTIVIESRDAVCKQFAKTAYIDELRRIIDRAVALSENDDCDLENIRRLGQGWVAEETLAIAVYCSLRHEYEFSEGIIAAVNHSGDSDSTGAVTGNILGAICGYEAIDEKWKRSLELRDVILEMADDLNNIHSVDGDFPDPEWVRKYERMRSK